MWGGKGEIDSQYIRVKQLQLRLPCSVEYSQYLGVQRSFVATTSRSVECDLCKCYDQCQYHLGLDRLNLTLKEKPTEHQKPQKKKTQQRNNHKETTVSPARKPGHSLYFLRGGEEAGEGKGSSKILIEQAPKNNKKSRDDGSRAQSRHRSFFVNFG